MPAHAPWFPCNECGPTAVGCNHVPPGMSVVRPVPNISRHGIRPSSISQTEAEQRVSKETLKLPIRPRPAETAPPEPRPMIRNIGVIRPLGPSKEQIENSTKDQAPRRLPEFHQRFQGNQERPSLFVFRATPKPLKLGFFQPWRMMPATANPRAPRSVQGNHENAPKAKMAVQQPNLEGDGVFWRAKRVPFPRPKTGNFTPAPKSKRPTTKDQATTAEV